MLVLVDFPPYNITKAKDCSFIRTNRALSSSFCMCSVLILKFQTILYAGYQDLQINTHSLSPCCSTLPESEAPGCTVQYSAAGQDRALAGISPARSLSESGLSHNK